MTLRSTKKWKLPKKTSTKPFEGLSNIVSKLLRSRGIKTKAAAKDFLNPSLDQVPDWKLLHGAREGAKEIVKAIKEDKSIFIHGDFDADGICATAVLWEFLYKEAASILEKEVKCTPYIPDRVKQGYGLSKSSIDEMVNKGAQLIITVDCGIRDKELIDSYLKENKDLSFIITDHHQPPEDITEKLNYTVVHQMFPGHEFPFMEISGTTIAWLFTQALASELGVEVDEKSMRTGLDLVGLSTVTDMMPLAGINRALVDKGLEEMHKSNRQGLSSLAKVANVKPSELQAYHLGFVLGPRINAAGRIGSPMEALRMLVSTNSQQAIKRAAQLNTLNGKRQFLTQEILDKARAIAQEKEDDLLLFVIGEEWPEGIIGLAAGKLTEEFQKPTIVVSINGDEARGSARSFGGLNITDALTNYADLLVKYGGHAQAAGFSVKEGKLEELQESLVKFVNDNYTQKDFVQELNIDLVIDSADLELTLVEELDMLRPYGYGNKTPLLMLERMVVVSKQIMGKDQSHMKLTLKGEDIGFTTAVMFNCKEDIETITEDSVIDLAGNASINEWNGNKSIQFIVKEWRESKL